MLYIVNFEIDLVVCIAFNFRRMDLCDNAWYKKPRYYYYENKCDLIWSYIPYFT